MLSKGYAYQNYIGELTETVPVDDDNPFLFGINDPQPVELDVKDIKSWYKGEHGTYLPAETIAIPDEHYENQELVRALNFWKAGDEVIQQVILFIKGTPQQVISTFDLSISQIATDGECMYWGKHTMQDLIRGRMRVERIHHPMSTLTAS